MTAIRQIPDFDSPWKELIFLYFVELMALLFPKIHAVIDWSKPYEFLDKELQKIYRKSKPGRRYVDKLIKVWLLDGTEQWLLIHIEVQTVREAGFAKRMYKYNIRLIAEHDRAVISLAILADDNPKWRPNLYQANHCGCRTEFEFPIAKLIDLNDDELAKSDNRVALFIRAYLKARETRRDPKSRLNWKTHFVRELYHHGLSREDVQQLFRLIDWVMELPKELDEEFEVRLEEIEQEQTMRYVTQFERRATERGLAKGIEQGIERGRVEALRGAIVAALEAKFGRVARKVIARINQVEDLTVLQELHREAVKVQSVAELFADH